MPPIRDVIDLLNQTSLDLLENYLEDKIERDPENKITFCHYGQPLGNHAEPEHIQEVDDAIRRALKLGWNPNDQNDYVCRYSYFLWNAVESSYLHHRANEIQKESE